jgi:hypothetical protein
MRSSVVVGSLLVAGGLMALAASGNSQPAPDSPDQGQDILITDNDRVFDYKREAGVWFTRRKGNTAWIDMRKNLSDDKYQEAMQVLSDYMIKQNRAITIQRS